MPLSLRQLRAFESVVATGSFTAAAKRLGLTQSAVSMLVRQMETEIGLPLFDRSGRRVRLTGFGTEVRPTVARILDEIQNLSEGAADLRALRRGHLRIAVSQILACTWLPTLIARFSASYPEVELSVIDTTGDRVVEAVAENEADIGIGPERTPRPGTGVRYLWRVPIQLVVPRDGALADATPPLDLRDLPEAPWIHYSDEFNLHLERMARSRPATAGAGLLTVRGLSTALALVGQGQGVTAAPAYAALFSETFGVTFRDIAGEAGARRYNLYHRSTHDLSPAAAAFGDLAASCPP